MRLASIESKGGNSGIGYTRGGIIGRKGRTIEVVPAVDQIVVRLRSDVG